jgi:hypothetical protein
VGSVIQKCIECGASFELRSDEIKFFTDRGLNKPKRCRDCRRKKRGKQGGRITLKDGLQEE